MKYVAVGFKVNQDRSIFYLKGEYLGEFMNDLMRKIIKKEPDFVSLRMVREK